MYKSVAFIHSSNQLKNLIEVSRGLDLGAMRKLKA